jgi:hypothetical protein
MRVVLAMSVFAAGLLAQAPDPAPVATPVGGVQFDSGGWPIVADDRPPAAPGGAATTGRPTAAAAAAPALASGMQLGSPLLDVFQSTRSPAAFKALGGVVVWWRLTIFGAQGEVIGVREVTHTADCAFSERDRLEHADGRIYGRSAASVFAERQGMPWPTLAEAAQQELMLYGLQLRLPWCFGDAAAFVVTGRDTVDRGGQTLSRLVVEQRPPTGADVIGPELDPRPRDRYELVFEPSTGQPREFVHRFASTMQARRVLLEDWRDVALGERRDGGAVRMPFRRVYVDESMRQTTQMEILRIESARVTERDFRLH